MDRLHIPLPEGAPYSWSEAHAQLIVTLGIPHQGRLAPAVHKAALEKAAEGRVARSILSQGVQVLRSARAELDQGTPKCVERAAKKLTEVIDLIDQLENADNIVAVPAPPADPTTPPTPGIGPE